jgi:two-component system, OmpR family, response regulator
MTSSPMRILCIDDDSDIRTIAAMALGLDPDMDVRAADGGEAGLAIIEAGEWMPDAVLLDVMMPGLDGPEVLARLRQLPGGTELPVVFMTARARQADIEAYLALGAVGVVTKPFDPLGLAGEIRALVARAG